MKTHWYKVFLILLRALVYLKRAVVWLARPAGGLFLRLWQGYATYIGFRRYKIVYAIKRGLRLLDIRRDGGAGNIIGRRLTLELLLLTVSLAIIFPHSRLYGRDSNTIPGRKTLLYHLVGPGEIDSDIEELSADFGNAAAETARSWREGAVISEFPAGAFPAGPAGPQEIAGISAGGSAISKPIILPGAQLPSAGDAKRSAVFYYEVVLGDVIGQIAGRFGVSITTILWANNLTARSYIRPGDKLKIPPTDGVLHKVVRGDNVAKIARLYSAKTDDVIRFNKLQEDGRDIVIGEELFIPGGLRPQPVYAAPTRRPTPFSNLTAPPPSIAAPAGSGYIWPTEVRRITQYFGLRHTGVDIAGPSGKAIYAAKSGTVIRSQCGYNGGYGCYVIIDHGGGVHTLYGHNSQLFVSVGEEVTQGQTIAAMGSTGRSTGPHVHFEVRVNGRRQNPLRYIR